MVRTYEKTHPWIDFSLDLNRFDYRLWMALGEAGSKCDHIAGVPLAPKVAEEMHVLYLTKGAAATTAIEGNTLSEEDAGRAIAGDLRLPESQQYLIDEIQNIVTAFNFLVKEIFDNGKREVTVDLLRRLNSLVLDNLELEDSVTPGDIRRHNVVVGPYRCAPAEDCHFLLEKLCAFLNDFKVPDSNKQAFAIVKAVYAHLYFVWIHPFGDGNGRTARLLELFVLLCAGMPSPAGHLLSNHYNKTRSKYYQVLNNAVNGQTGVIDFITYSTNGFVDGLREQISFIKDHQWNVAWLSFLHEKFHHRNGVADVRRRHLVLALSEKRGWIPSSKIKDLSPEMAREYYGKTHKTVTRDINTLSEMGLVTKDGNKVKANREIILAFLPDSTNGN